MSPQEQLVVGKPQIGRRTSPQPAGPVAATAPAPSGGRKRLLAAGVAAVLVAGAGAGYWFTMGPASVNEAVATAQVEPAPELGVVQGVEAVSINLAGGRYLRIGLGLQLPADLEEELDPSKALDLTIALFSGRSIEEVSSGEGRVLLKAELAKQLGEAYHGEVLDVYLTEYVTQ